MGQNRMREFDAIVEHLVSNGDGGVLGHPGDRRGLSPIGGRVPGSLFRRPAAASGRSAVVAWKMMCCCAPGMSSPGRAKPDIVIYDTTSENDLRGARPGLPWNRARADRTRRRLARAGPSSPWTENLRANRPDRAGGRHGGRGRRRSPEPGKRKAKAGRNGEGIFHSGAAGAAPGGFRGRRRRARPLVRLAKEFGWRVTVADPRAGLRDGGAIPRGRIGWFAPPPKPWSGRRAPEEDALVVVMTHHHVHDVPILKDLIGLPLPYLGLLGPKNRASLKKFWTTSLRGRAVPRPGTAWRGCALRSDWIWAGRHARRGIALSIIAEMHAVLAGRDGRPLRERKGPIHA